MRVAPLLLASLALLAAAEAEDKPGESAAIFDGRSLAGWKASEEGAGAFSAADGELRVHGGRGHLFYVGADGQASFRNFEFSAQVRTHAKANSGIYFHTAYQRSGWPDAGYEAQVNATHQDRRKTGGLYGVADVMDTPAAPDDRWFEYRIRVEGKRIRVWIDGRLTTDFTEPEGWKAPEGMPGRRLGSGTFALQAHDPGCRVEYRDLRVTRLP